MSDSELSGKIQALEKELEEYKFAYKRERFARKQSEEILEEQVRELYYLNKDLYNANQALVRHQKRTIANEKMAALGTLSAGMAHEINNPLAFVISNIRSLNKYFKAYSEIFAKIGSMPSLEGSGDQLLEKIIQDDVKGLRKNNLQITMLDSDMIFDDIDEGLHRVKDIIANLKNFSRSKSNEKIQGDVTDAVRSALKIMESKLKNRCEIKCSIEKLPEFPCNIGELTQVFINLFSNALEAMNNNGLIEIDGFADDHSVTITVKDNGSGISEDMMSNIFLPFYTDKPVGLGTGLGLSISHGIIEDHGGTITVDSELGKGSIFYIWIPIKPFLGTQHEFPGPSPIGIKHS